MGKGTKNKSKDGAAAATAPVEVTLKPEFDSELDALFSKAVQPPPAAASSSSSSRPAPVKSEQGKANATASAVSSDDEDSEDSEESDDGDDKSLAMSDIEREMEEQGLGLREGEDADEVEDDGEEGAQDDDDAASDDESSSSDDSDASPPLHETLSGIAGQKRVRRKLEEREQESQQTRDQRTIFVGNLPIDVLQDRSLTRTLKKHIIDHSPYPSITKIEAIRFRSVAFARPTMDYAAESGADAAANEKRRARSRKFADAVAAADAADGKGPAQVYLNAKQKRKVAYINQEINEKAKSVNAYVTLAPITEQRRAKLAAGESSSEAKAAKVTAPILAALTASQLDETLFEGRHLRVDLVAPLPLAELVQSGLDAVVASASSLQTTEMQSLARILTGGGGSNRREDQPKTVFVGNLDFEADEEELRAVFEAVLRQERGEPPLSSSLQGSGVSAGAERSKALSSLPPFESRDAPESYLRKTWVQSVRLIRDSATQMGKGFGYVRFLDEACVDELMAVWESDEAFLAAAKQGGRGGGRDDGRTETGGRLEFRRRLKLNRRALRLARCKGAGNGGGGKNKRQRDAEAGDGEAGSATPQRNKDTKRRRSMGAPTPGGSSPSTHRRNVAAAANAHGTPSKKAKTITPGTSSASVSASGIVANPSPAQPRSAADLARLELKRNDPARQAKRLAKKQKKRDEIKGGGGKKESHEAVDLRKVAGKMKKERKGRQGGGGK